MSEQPIRVGHGGVPDPSYEPRPPAPPKRTRGARMREFMAGMPLVNRVLLIAGAVAALLGLAGLILSMIVSPLYRFARASVQPYTASGKQERCMSNLRNLGQALAMYAGDHGGTYPPLDYGAGAGRTTWVTLLRERGGKELLLCPNKSVGDERTGSSYAFNPVLGAQSTSAVTGEEPSPETLLLADRGDEHDVALLPPLPGWKAERVSTAVSGGGEQATGNLSYTHSGTATVLFADGHVESRQLGAWLQDLNLWGGSLAVRQSAAKLRSRHPVLGQVQAALDRGDENAGTAILGGSREKAREGLLQVLTLWKANTGEKADADVEKWGWQLGRLWSGAGEKRIEQELNAELSLRSKAELAKVQSGTWEKYLSDDGFFVERPSDWKVETIEDSYYKRTYFRSGSPHISVQVEKGVRSTEGPQAPIEWDGMEPGQAAQPGNRYKRLQMGTTDLSGQTAGLWSFEVERSGEPRLRKLYIGRSHRWDSFIIVCIAPASDWKQWQPVLYKMVRTFTYVGE